MNGDVRSLVALLRTRHETLAVAESLTGGMLAARVVDVPGASAVLRGGIVAYATEMKAVLLGVDRGLLERKGPVDPDVAAAMARGVRERLGATWGLSTTGVAGPDPADGHPPGTVYVGVGGPGGVRVNALCLRGGRAAVREQAVLGAFALLADVLDAAGRNIQGV